MKNEKQEQMSRLQEIVTAMCSAPWEIKSAEERGLLYVLEKTAPFTIVRPFEVVEGTPTFLRGGGEDDKIIVPTSEQDTMQLCKLYHAVASAYDKHPGEEKIRFEPTPRELSSPRAFAQSRCICKANVDAALQLLPYAPVFMSIELSGESPAFTREFLKQPTMKNVAIAQLIKGPIDERVTRFTQMYLDSRKLSGGQYRGLHIIPYFSKDAEEARRPEWKEILKI